MAEIASTESRSTHGTKKGKKLSTRVDLTPMVDLGFLLITFFIFTTTLSEPKTMSLTVPSDKPTNEPTTVPKGKTLNLILGPHNTILYYMGDEQDKVATTNYASSGVRNVILQKMKEVAQHYGDAKETIILIKPLESSTYQNLVAILDEMAINGVKRYILMDADSREKSFSANNLTIHTNIVKNT